MSVSTYSTREGFTDYMLFQYCSFIKRDVGRYAVLYVIVLVLVLLIWVASHWI